MKLETRQDLESFFDALEAGQIRTASKSHNGEWVVHPEVKQGILLAFRLSTLVGMDSGEWSFVDKDLIPPQKFDVARGVRVVPGGTTVRRGAFVAPGVIIMPPAYINVGAFVDEGTLVDSHALVGSCAQIGKRVHLSAAAQIGGVLEPIGALPVIVEDDAFIGGNCGVYEGTIIRSKAVIAAGVVLTASTKVYDLVNQRTLVSEPGKPLEIPEGAVVVPGSRPISDAWGKQNGLQISTPIIIKYRDDRTDSKAALEDALRLG